MSDIPHEHDEDPIIPDPSEIDPRPGRKRNRPKRIEGRPVERDERDERMEPPPTQTAGAGQPPKAPKKTALAGAGGDDRRGNPSRDPSKRQMAKFLNFSRHGLKLLSLQLVKQAVEVAGLATDNRGVTWGVTVCPDSSCVIRLNIGNVAQLSVMRDVLPDVDPTGADYYIVAAIDRGEIEGKALPSGLHIRRGFEKHFHSSIQLYAELIQWSTTLFNDPDIGNAFARHAEYVTRSLPNTNWHNPFVNQLLDAPNK